MTESLIVAEGVDKVYLARGRMVSSSHRTVRKPRLQALSGINLDIRKGEILAIVGESGSGKSTLARLLVNLDRPTRGKIDYPGLPVARHRRGRQLAIARRVQIVFQDPRSSLDPRMSASTSIREPLEIQDSKLTRREVDARVRDLLRAVGLGSEHSSRYPGELSGGQLQRVAIARALALRPSVIVCDEPTSALDVSIQAQILTLLLQLRSEFALSLVLITHDLAVVRQVADRTSVMYMGRIIEAAPTEVLFTQAAHPYTRSLLASAPDLEKTLEGGGSLDNLPVGEAPSPLDPPSGCHFRTRCLWAAQRCADEVPLLSQRDNRRQEVACFFPR